MEDERWSGAAVWWWSRGDGSPAVWREMKVWDGSDVEGGEDAQRWEMQRGAVVMRREMDRLVGSDGCVKWWRWCSG